MFTHKVIKAVAGKVNRSGFHHLVIPGLHGNRTAETEHDIFGTVMIVIFTVVVVFLARVALAH